MSVLIGCQSNPSGGVAWPWQPNSTQVASLPNNPSNGPWSPVGTDPNAQMAELFARGNQQSQLAEQQRQALEELVEMQRSQEMQMTQMAHQQRQQFQNDEMDKLRDQAEQLAAQKREIGQLTDLRRQALELDANNQDLHAKLAQMQQQNRVLEDQVRLMRQQLSDTADQLTQSVQARQQVEQQAAASQKEVEERMAALNSRPGGATITANNSVRKKLTAITVSGLNVRQDGDVVRIELPSDRVFNVGTASLTSDAVGMVDQVATTLRQHYAQQVIGVEAHTDSGSMPAGAWRSKHQLSAAQAMAIFDQLAERHQFAPQQLFVLGHGPNYPVASNATPAGQQRNRRVEIVVYPETFGRQ
ncbi:MAG: OmpA family protein [Planctomycetota bacterium]